MKLLPESNSFYRVNMREKLSKILILKYVVMVIVLILGIGFFMQKTYNFVAGEKIGSRMNYTRLDGKRIDYKLSGAGDFTVIFDGSIGGGSAEWTDIAERTSKELGVKTFIYDRRGYGFSDGGELLTPEEQAEQLKTILRKAAASGPYILVGEGYGSLVMTNFAKQNPDLIKGVVLINPIDEKNEESKIGFLKLLKEKIQASGSHFFFTWILDKIGLATDFSDLEEKLKYDYQKYNYSWQKNQNPYRESIYNESKVIKKGLSDSQVDGMFKDIPLYIISGGKTNSLARLGSKDLTTEYMIENSEPLYAMSDPDVIIKGIDRVVDTARRIERKNKGNN